MMLLEPLLSESEEIDFDLRGSVLRMALAAATAVGIGIAPMALFYDNALWLVLAIGFPVLFTVDAVRYLSFATKRMKTPLLVDATWFVGGAFLFLFRNSLSPTMILGSWIASAGCGILFFGRSSIRDLAPSGGLFDSLVGDRAGLAKVTRQGLSYLVGFVSSAGLTTALLFLLAFRATNLDVAVFRIAVAIGGIASLMTAALYAVLVPKIVSDPARTLPGKTNILLISSCLAASATIVLLPNSVGGFVFGQTWQEVKILQWPIVGFILLKFAEVPYVARLRADNNARAVMEGRLVAAVVLLSGIVLGLLLTVNATRAFLVTLISMLASLIYWSLKFGTSFRTFGTSFRTSGTVPRYSSLAAISIAGGAVVLVPNLWLILAVATAFILLKVRDLPALMKSSADTAAVVMSSLGVLGVALYPFYKNGGVIMSSLDRLTLGQRTHTLLVFLWASIAMLVGGRLAKKSGVSKEGNAASDELLRNLGRFAPILILTSAATTVVFSIGFGIDQLVDRDSYIPPTYPMKELMAGTSLLLLPCMGALAVSRELTPKSSSRALSSVVAVALFVLAFATGGREMAAMPLVFFIAGFAIRSAQGRQPKRLVRKVFLICLVSTLLYPVPVALRQLEGHGLVDYAASLVDGTMIAELGEPDFLVGTVMFSIPMLTVAESAEEDHWLGDLGAAANPLPGRYTSWGEREDRLQYIRFSDTAGVPFSTLGTISAGGWVVLVGLFTLFGFLLEDAAARASRRYGPIVGAVSMPIGGLFSILAAQYPARQVARYLLLLILLNLWCRRPSKSERIELVITNMNTGGREVKKSSRLVEPQHV